MSRGTLIPHPARTVNGRQVPAASPSATSWGYKFSFSDPSTGKRRQVMRRGFPTKKAAQAALTEALAEHQRGERVEPTRMTVGQYLTDQWLPMRRSQVKATTWSSYSDVIHGRIVPMIGGLPLQAITPRHVADLYRDLLDHGGRDQRRNGGRLSARSVRYTGMVLRRALDDAVRLGLLQRNPAAQVERPRADAVEMQVWTVDEARAFLATAGEHRLSALWTLLLTTGLRRGEVLGLKWGDLDLDAGRLAIRRTLVANGYTPEWSTPKTEKSTRVVAIDPGTVEALRAHRRRQLEERLALGEGYRDDGLVFCRPDGTILHPQNVSQTFERLEAKAGVPRIRLHDTRHTAATVMLALGVPLKVVSERLGHSSTKITADVYQHVSEHMQAEAAAQLGAAFLGGG